MRGIIFHYGLFKIIWDWFVLLLVLYTAIEVPFVVAFLNPTFATKPESKLYFIRVYFWLCLLHEILHVHLK